MTVMSSTCERVCHCARMGEFAREARWESNEHGFHSPHSHVLRACVSGKRELERARERRCWEWLQPSVDRLRNVSGRLCACEGANSGAH